MHIHNQLWDDTETKHAILSSWAVADDGWMELYVDMFPMTKVMGVSLGLAAVIAMFGISCAKETAFTGYVQGFGFKVPLSDYAVFPVDCEKTKMTQLASYGTRLVLSSRSKYAGSGVTSECGGTEVSTLGEALQIALTCQTEGDAMEEEAEAQKIIYGKKKERKGEWRKERNVLGRFLWRQA